jgi:hypothetical protein
MADRFIVEKILSQIAFTGLQMETFQRSKGQDKPQSLTPGTIASNCALKISFNNVFDCATLTTAFIM